MYSEICFLTLNVFFGVVGIHNPRSIGEARRGALKSTTAPRVRSTTISLDSNFCLLICNIFNALERHSIEGGWGEVRLNLLGIIQQQVAVLE